MKEGLKYFTDTHFTLFGLLIFFIWFVLMCFWVYRLQSPQFHEQMSMLPLNDEGGRHD